MRLNQATVTFLMTKKLKSFLKWKQKKMSKHFVNFFEEKRNERIKTLIGENQNIEIEKEFFYK